MITANQFFKGSFETYRTLVLLPGMSMRLVNRNLPSPLKENIDSDSPPLEAYVNHGRWVVKCECGGAEKAWEEGWFMCQSCFNAGHKHQYRRSIFPKERLKIENLLEVRPLPNRNWYPGETLSQLQAENKEHKAELLEVS